MSNSIINADKKLKAHAQEALDALKAANVTIVTAESRTAGTVAALLAQAEGGSDILHGGSITYTKEHKTKGLGIPWRLLKEQGAVNGDVVKQLAAGALERSPASMAIAISGVLGAEPDEDGNPVGLVYFCLIRKDQQPTHPRNHRSGGRTYDLPSQPLTAAIARLLSGRNDHSENVPAIDNALRAAT